MPGAYSLARLQRHERILEEIESEGLLAGHAEDLHVLVVDVDQRAVRSIKLHPDLNVVENVAQETFVAVDRLVGLVHLGPVGLRRLLGTLQVETQPDDIDQRREPLAVLVGPLTVFVDDVDAGIAPDFVPRGQRHDEQRLDILRRQQIVFARRLGRQVADVGKNNGIAL